MRVPENLISHLDRALVVLAGGVLLASTAWAAPLPTNNNPANQIRFDTPAEADAKRQQLTEFIWATGLPTSALPTITSNLGSSIFAADLSGVNQTLVSQVSRLDANVSGFDFHSLSYLLTPVNAVHSDRVVIVHQGHSYYAGRLDSGIGETVNSLLLQGFTVNVMQMPLFGWNNDDTATVPGQGNLTYGTTFPAGHEAMITLTGAPQGGTGFRLFLEPVVQSINYFQTIPGFTDVSMIGISGGGWTTHLAAALDTRITLSIPVAGSAPFYYRNTDPQSIGDLEQFYEPLFNENIAADGSGGSIATWLEIYALGGYGSGREQIMVTNLNDSCCFRGNFADSFKTIVSDSVDLLGQGSWDYYLDQTTLNMHLIAPNTISQVLFPALNVVRSPQDQLPGNSIPEPSSIGLALIALLCCAGVSRCRAKSTCSQVSVSQPRPCLRKLPLRPRYH